MFDEVFTIYDKDVGADNLANILLVESKNDRLFFVVVLEPVDLLLNSSVFLVKEITEEKYGKLKLSIKP